MGMETGDDVDDARMQTRPGRVTETANILKCQLATESQTVCADAICSRTCSTYKYLYVTVQGNTSMSLGNPSFQSSLPPSWTEISRPMGMA